MKNRLVFVALVIAAFVSCDNALPARKRMVYYQQPAVAQWYGTPQRNMMYVQYVQPSSKHSTQATSALVAGETVAAGTYLEDCNHAESDVAAAGPTIQHGEDVLSAVGVHSAHSVAEAYPDDTSASAPAPPSRSSTVEVETENTGTVVADVPTVAVSTDEQQPEPTHTESDNASKTPRDYNFDTNASDEPLPPVAPEQPAPVPIAPVATAAVVPPVRRYLPSKKVYVELDHSVEATDAEQTDNENAIAIADDEEAQEEDEETDVAPVVPVAPKKPVQKPSARRPVAKNPAKPVKAASDCSGCAKAGSSGSSKPQIPAGTFFPIDFGGTAGGAIAIANSFSTGEGGSATSHAIAYGSPEGVRARAKPSKLH